MGRLTEIDWNLVQFKFEVLGYSLEDIRDEYELTDAHVAYISKDWKPIPASQRENLQFTDMSSLEELTDSVANRIVSEATTLQTLKQRHLLTKYIELENILVNKAISLASQLREDRSSVSALNTLSNVLTTLLNQNPMIKPKSDEVEGGSGESREWVVTVVDPQKDKNDGS